VWSTIALAVTHAFGLPAVDMVEVIPSFAAAGVITSFVITWLFSDPLCAPNVKTKYWLPFATIVCAVPIWSTVLFTISAIVSVIHGRHDLFDGFWLFVIVGVVSPLTVALPVAYPTAYFTQLVVSRYVSPKNA